jgi:hypothetical protein
VVEERAKPRCHWLLRICGVNYCREIWQHKVMAEAERLVLGCPADCSRYKAAYPTRWDTPAPGVDSGTKRE